MPLNGTDVKKHSRMTFSNKKDACSMPAASESKDVTEINH